MLKKRKRSLWAVLATMLLVGNAAVTPAVALANTTEPEVADVDVDVEQLETEAPAQNDTATKQPTKENNETSQDNKSNPEQANAPNVKIISTEKGTYVVEGGSTLTQEDVEKAEKEDEDFAKVEATKESEESKVKSFEDVDFNDAKSILEALENKDFPFLDESDLWVPGKYTSTTAQQDAFKKTRRYAELRYAELSGNSEVSARAFRMLRASGVLTSSGAIRDPNGGDWVVLSIPTKGPNAGMEYMHDRIEKWTINGETVFCIEGGVVAGNGLSHSTVNASSVLTAKQIADVSYIISCGWTLSSNKSNARYVTVQTMVWEALGDKIVAVSPGFSDAYKEHRATITKAIADYKKNPSFAGNSKTVKVGEEVKFTDTNGAMKNIKSVKAPAGISAKVSGNNLVVKATSASAPDTATIQMFKNPTPEAALVWKTGSYQKLANLPIQDPGRTTVTVKVLKAGKAQIKKTNEEGKALEGAKFEILNHADDVTTQVTTDKNGLFLTGEYEPDTKLTITEIEAPRGYLLDPTPKDVTIVAGKTTEVTFVNKAPKVSTTATAQDGTKSVFVDKEAKVNDEVKMTNLVKGKHYLVKGTLMVKETGEVAKDAEGKDVVAEKAFVAEGQTANETLTFTVDALKYKGKHFVVFEKLYETGDEGTTEPLLVGSHEDINDAGQTVEILAPSIGTTAKSVDGTDHVKVSTEETIVDTVTYKNLKVGHTYTVNGVLMDKATNKPILVDGKEIKSSVTLEAKKDTPGATFDAVKDTITGSIDVTFTFDSTALIGKEIVVFEDVLYEDREVAIHHDINDEGQTVTVVTPEIGTTAKNAEDDTDYIQGYKEVSIVDTVAYKNLKAGETYTINGILMDKETGEPLLVEGNVVEAETTFTPNVGDEGVVVNEENNTISGTADVTFTFDASHIKGKDVVVFEKLIYAETEIAKHEDIEDEGQTVNVLVPEVETTAKAVDNNGDYIDAEKHIVITDKVTYTKVKVGKEYTVKGILMDKATNEPYLDAEGNTVENELKFTPQKDTPGAVYDEATNTVSGYVELEFTIERPTPGNTDIVVFEDLLQEDIELAVHHDIEDLGQTVKVFVPEIGTTATNGEDGSKIFDALDKVVLEDKVEYKDLIKGEKYQVTGIIMDRETGEPLLVNGEMVRKVYEFVAGEDEVTDVTEDNPHVEEEDNVEEDGAVDETETEESTEGSDNTEVAVTDITKVDEGNEAEGNETEGNELVDDRDPAELEAVSGFVTVTFEFDASELAGKEITVFESLDRNGREVATHEDINDEGQTVAFTKPELHTTATDKTTGGKEVEAESTVTVQDKVDYEGLIPGKEYTLNGKLMDKSTNTVLKVNGKEVTATTKFTPESESGSVLLDFVFDASGLTTGQELVAFEDVSRNDTIVATHSDINDEGQTVKIKRTPKPTKTFSNTNGSVMGGVMLLGLTGLLGATVVAKRRKSA